MITVIALLALLVSGVGLVSAYRAAVNARLLHLGRRLADLPSEEEISRERLQAGWLPDEAHDHATRIAVSEPGYKRHITPPSHELSRDLCLLATTLVVTVAWMQFNILVAALCLLGCGLAKWAFSPRIAVCEKRLLVSCAHALRLKHERCLRREDYRRSQNYARLLERISELGGRPAQEIHTVALSPLKVVPSTAKLTRIEARRPSEEHVVSKWREAA